MVVIINHRMRGATRQLQQHQDIQPLDSDLLMKHLRTEVIG